MRILKKSLLFCVGGTVYVGLEYLWRGWSHRSMFFAGGICFLLLGLVDRAKPSLPVRCIAGSVIITAVELITGLLVNRDYSVWDYRGVPGNFLGQICLPFSLLWLPVGLLAQYLYRFLNAKKSPSVS